MIINPTIQQTCPPSLSSLFDAHKSELFKNLNCCRIGVIKEFFAGDANTAPTATVEIAQTQVASISPDGTKTLQAFPPILSAPVFFPSGGGFTLTFPVAAGDECLVLFHDRELDNWLKSGAGQAPTTPRMHDLSDAVILVGMRSNPRALDGISTAATQLRSDDGQTLVEVGTGKIQLIADEVVIHARNKATFDANGTGFVYTANQIDRYENGVSTSNNAPHPPEVPT